MNESAEAVASVELVWRVRLWPADIKEIPTFEGKLYLASVLDCFSRKVVGWSMRDDMKTELVVA